MSIAKLLAGLLTNNQGGFRGPTLYWNTQGLKFCFAKAVRGAGGHLGVCSCFVTFLSLSCLAFAGVFPRTRSSLFTEAVPFIFLMLLIIRIV